MRTKGAKDIKPRKKRTKRPVWTADYDLVAINQSIRKNDSQWKKQSLWLIKNLIWFVIGFITGYVIL